MDSWIRAFQSTKEGLEKCTIYSNSSGDDTYDTCGDQSRNSQIIRVVQSPKDVIAMEKTRGYSGVYHVLNGVISTSEGILPEGINVDSLLNKISKETEEIIIATNPTAEDETTALYSSKLPEKYPVTVTGTTHGLPMGGHLGYADGLILVKAIEGRKKVEP